MAYLYFIKTRILISLTYRFEVIFSILSQIVLLTVGMFFWRTVYGSRDIIDGVTLEQMLVFTVISVFLRCFFFSSVEGQLRQRIREGNVSVDLIKPIGLFGMYLADDIGWVIVNLTQKFVPTMLFAYLFMAPPLPASAFHLMLFIISAVISFFMLWLVAAIFGLLNFWLIDIGAIGVAKNHIIYFLSGAFIPIWFFPEWIQRVLSFTPFVYMYQTPLGIYIGITSLGQAAFEITIQLVWCAVFFLIFNIIKARAMKNVVVQGG